MPAPNLASLADPRSLATQSRDLVAESARWLSENTLEMLLGLWAAVMVVVVLIGLRALGLRLCRDATSERLRWRTVAGRALARTNLFFMVALAAELVTTYGAAPGSVRATAHFLFVVAATLQVAIWARELIMGAIEHRAGGQRHEALGSALGILRLLVSIVVFGIAGLTILSNLGVDVTGLVAGLGIGGIAIGLAAQGIFADLFAAISILFDRPFRRGDTIRWDETTGKVEAIGLKSTRVRALSGEEVVISNKGLLDKELHNLKRLEHRRVTLPLGLTFESPRDKLAAVPGLVRAIVEAEPACRFVRCGLQGFGESSLDFELQYDVVSTSFDEVFDTRHRVNMAILARLGDEGLSFAYPTQVSYVANPDGTLVPPYPDVQKVDQVDEPPAPAPALVGGGRVARFLSRA